MKPLSETLKELGIAFTFPIEIEDADGNDTYYEDSDSGGMRWERDVNGDVTYFKSSDGDWARFEYDANGNDTYFENSNGYKSGTPRSNNNQ